ncbi:MAG: dienelactone hydrolase family protein [Rhodanobacteraceae bacterium]
MGTMINLATSNMQCIGAYLAEPAHAPRGGIVVVQEIFGINAHMRRVADGFASHGYTAIAPALFDHVENGLELDYDEASKKKGIALVREIGLERAIEDVASAAEAIASAGRIGCVGYCWGGTVALLAATRLGLPAVSYYGGRDLDFLDEPLRAPVQFHFGERDRSISAEAIEQHRKAYPECEVFTYPKAGHAFNRDVGDAWEPDSARLALERTLAFFERNLAAAATDGRSTPDSAR